MKLLTNKWVVIVLLMLLYAGTRLVLLTKLPVFADEAIYIRWSQVGQNEPEKYRYLSMLDGKPPLHNWLITPLRYLIADPLLASRFLSVLAGALMCLYIFGLGRMLTKSKNSGFLAVLLSIASPFFLINERMGLAESLLTLFFISGIYYGMKVFTAPTNRWVVVHTLLFALSWGLALWTKTNAIFFALAYALLPVLNYQLEKRSPAERIGMVFLGGLLGGLFFLILKHLPLFSFLFSRSQDYTFSVSEILNGEWRYILFSSLPKIVGWIAWYSIPLLLILSFFESKINKVLLLMAGAYALPLVGFGKILSSRYFFPIAPLLILMMVLGVFEMRKKPVRKKISTIILCASFIWAGLFAIVHISVPNKTWYIASDRQQYLEDWSSGHGIAEVRDFIRERVQDRQVVVATEGYFGTLPDGLMMYFDGTPEIQNLELYGIGQPIRSLPENLYEKAKVKEVYVVVNSHRFLMPLTPQIQKIGEFVRPNNAPSLLLLKVNAS